MRGAQSISTRRAYGVQRVCRSVAPRPLQRLRAAAGNDVPGAVSAARADWCRPGRRPSRPPFAGCSKRRPFMVVAGKMKRDPVAT